MSTIYTAYLPSLPAMRRPLLLCAVTSVNVGCRPKRAATDIEAAREVGVCQCFRQTGKLRKIKENYFLPIY